MIGTTSEVNSQVTDLVFVIEGTANMGAYLAELRANYILPTLEYFNGGPASEDKDYGSELNSTMYSLVVFMAADIAPESAVTCFGYPTTCISKFLGWLDKIPFLGGAAEGSSHIAEGLGAALQSFDDFQNLRDPHITTQKHCILICNSPPYPLPCLESLSYAGMLCEQLASSMGDRNINLSIISPRKIPALLKLFDKASGDLQLSQSKNYTKDRRHLVLLKGYHLQERPLSPTSVDIKDKLPISNTSLPIEKSMMPNNNLMSVSSPGVNHDFKGGVKRKVSSPPNNAPPFKQMATQSIGNMNPMGIGIHNQQQQQQQAGQQQSASMATTNTIIPGSMTNIQINVQQPQQMPIVNTVRPMGATGMAINRLPPPQSSQSFMNQPNPPNVTITKGPPLPVINSAPVETSMGRPIRDQTPVTGPQGQRMLWNPPGRAPLQVGPAGNAASGMQGVNLPNPGMSPLVSRLNQPARANSGIMAGQRPPGSDMLISMTRAPNVTAGNANAMNNTPGQGNLVGMLQQGNMTQAGNNILNQTQNMQPNMMHAANKDMNQQLNMGPPGGMMNTAPNMPNSIGGQQQQGVNQMPQMGNNQTMMNTQQVNSVQIGNPTAQAMQTPNQLPVQSNMIGGIGPSAMSGPMNQMNAGMGVVSGQSTMGQTSNPAMQGQAGNQPPPIQQPQQQQKEKRIIWQGTIEWQEKPKIPNDPAGKVNRHVPCQVAAAVNAMGECEVNADKWPKKLIMQLIPKVLMHQFGNAFLKASRNVVFHFSKGAESADALASLNKVMTSGFVGCVHFSGQQNVNCDIRILMLVFSNDMYTYVGFIPNDQVGFVATIRNVITKKQQQTAKQQQPGTVMPPQAQQQLFGVQGGQANQQMNPGMGPGMNLPMGGPGGGPAGGLSGPGNVSVLSGSLNSGAVTSGQVNMLASAVAGPNRGITLGPNVSTVQGRNSPNLQMQPQGMMASHAVTNNMNAAANPANNAAGGLPAAGKPQVAGMGNNQNQGNQVDQFTNERQQNLLKIEQLRQSLMAAQQKEVQFKAAQEQHQHHHVPNPLRQSDVLLLQQLQQQQQQQQQPRMLGNSAPTNSNPQLRQLLQISQQMMLSQQGTGQRQGVPELGQGPGSGQPPSLNTGSNIFPDDIL